MGAACCVCTNDDPLRVWALSKRKARRIVVRAITTRRVHAEDRRFCVSTTPQHAEGCRSCDHDTPHPRRGSACFGVVECVCAAHRDHANDNPLRVFALSKMVFVNHRETSSLSSLTQGWMSSWMDVVIDVVLDVVMDDTSNFLQ